MRHTGSRVWKLAGRANWKVLGQISGASNSPQPPVHVWSPGQRQAVASCLRRGEPGQQLLADSGYLQLPQQNEPGTSESDSQRAIGCDGTSAFARRRHRKKPKCRNFALKLPGSLSLSARHSVGGQARVIRYFSVAKVRRDQTYFWAHMGPCTIGGVLTTMCHFMQSCHSTDQLGVSDGEVDEVPQRSQGGNPDRVAHTKLGSWDPCFACFWGKVSLMIPRKGASEITEFEPWAKENNRSGSNISRLNCDHWS